MPIAKLGSLVFILLVGECVRAADAAPAVRLEQLPSVRSTLFDAKMVQPRVGGHRSFILIPPKPRADGERPWVWYAPTVLADREQGWISPGKRHAWIFKRLLTAGIYVAGVDVGESYGNPAGRAVYDRFYDMLVKQYHFAPKPGLLAISRGGLMAYNWAAKRPDCVGCIGCIYPLCNLASYRDQISIAEAYGMSVDQLRAEIDKYNPVEHLGPLTAARVPILHLHGDRDRAVPLELQSADLARRYRALGGSMQLIVVHGKGHEVALEYWQEPRLTTFFLKNLLLHR